MALIPKLSESDPIATIVAWAQARERIRAVLLTSTRAVSDAPVDALSDYDIILVVTELAPFASNRSWINDFGDVLVVYWDAVYPDPDFGMPMIGNVTQYADGLKIDFTVWTLDLFAQVLAAPALPDELDAGYRVLLDKDQLAAGLRPPTGHAYRPALPTLEAYQTWVNDFFSDPPYVAKCLWRDELLPAKWCLDHDMKHTYLRQLLEWRIALEYGGNVSVGALGKGLKRRLPPQIWSQLEACYAGAAIADNWLALDNTIVLFRQVAIEVGTQLGYPYPHELDQRVCAYVEHIRHMPSKQTGMISK